MLCSINIHNFTIIKELELDVSAGLTVITGETGVGKSIVIEAIEIALGSRANTTFIGPYSDKADIALSFSIDKMEKLQEILKFYELNDENQCVIRRTFYKNGSSKSFVNSIPTSLKIIREISETLISLHGQHEFQLLFNENKQRELLDKFSGCTDLTEKVQSLYNFWKTANDELETLLKQKQESAEKIDFLKYQLNEFDELGLAPEELNSLYLEHKQLSNAEEMLLQYQKTLTALEDNESGSAISLLNYAAKTIGSLIDYHPNLKKLSGTINGIIVELSDATRDIRNISDSTEINPERLQWIEKRLTKIHDISKKHRIKPEEFLEFYSKLKQDIETLLTIEDRLNLTKLNLTNLEKEYNDVANFLSEKRIASAKTFSKIITESIQKLGMPKGLFEVFIKQNTDFTPTRFGLETIIFLIKTNPGFPMAELSKIASGGELSRIALAIQVATAKQHDTPVLVFDEIDSGIGGEAADTVGEMLYTLSYSTQIICVTHLAQIAAAGNYHWQAKKIQTDTETFAEIKILNPNERIQELSRMIGGQHINEQTIQLAKLMLDKYNMSHNKK